LTRGAVIRNEIDCIAYLNGSQTWGWDLILPILAALRTSSIGLYRPQNMQIGS
jgi:hypothetical protein